MDICPYVISYEAHNFFCVSKLLHKMDEYKNSQMLCPETENNEVVKTWSLGENTKLETYLYNMYSVWSSKVRLNTVPSSKRSKAEKGTQF